jgi:SAM-dependent methyltransferase/uncharacterized protein YbaR (Trm112 family)
MKLSDETRDLLRCPACRSPLAAGEEACRCLGADCGLVFPVVDGAPVLINESRSVFSISDFQERRPTFFRASGGLEALVSRLVPEIDRNVKAAENYAALAELLAARGGRPKVLVVGGSTIGNGAERILSLPSIEVVESDVVLGPRIALIADGHDLPFADDSFDGVIVQAVLEHVVDPYRCVEEIHRVLKPAGLVYAETPFMQQVHGGRYDFTRFTHLGHRRVFRGFEEIASGAAGGPGMALAWAYQYFLLSFVKSQGARKVVKALARLTAFWLTFFDRYLIDRAGTLDAAAGYYFVGRKSGSVLPDRRLIQLYRGAGALLPARRVPAPSGARPAPGEMGRPPVAKERHHGSR